MAERVILRRFNYRHEAELVRSVLEGSGIDAVVTSDDCGAVDPALGLVRGACVAIDDKDVARAEDVLASPVGTGETASDPDAPGLDEP